MARRYTITNVTETGSSVQSFRTAISGSTTDGSKNKGYSDDTRMKSMFPKSPLYSTTSNYNTDSAIIDKFKTTVVDIVSIDNSYDFNGQGSNAKAYLNFNHPAAPSMTMETMNTPISGADFDKPYHGYPNLQVNGLDPLEPRDVTSGSDGGLLRKRTLEDGGFGTKNDKKNYATSEVRTSIGNFFTNTYSPDDNTKYLDSKFNSLGNSTMKKVDANASTKDSTLSDNVNNFVGQNGNQQ